jgi:hypothetical protein
MNGSDGLRAAAQEHRSSTKKSVGIVSVEALRQEFYCMCAAVHPVILTDETLEKQLKRVRASVKVSILASPDALMSAVDCLNRAAQSSFEPGKRPVAECHAEPLAMHLQP